MLVDEAEMPIAPDPQAADAEPEADLYAAQREENAQSARIAWAWMSQCDQVLHETYLLAVTLAPECKLMHTLTSCVAADWEQAQQEQVFLTQRRDFRAAQLHEGMDVQNCMKESLDALLSPTCWMHLPETEDMRTEIVRYAMKPASLCYQLLYIPTRGFPWLLFGLASREAQADEAAFRQKALQILSMPGCMRDGFTRRYLAKYSSAELLATADARMTLSMVAFQAACSAYSTERLHARNLRRTKAQPTHVPELPQLGLAHLSFAGPCWISPAESAQARGSSSMQENSEKRVKRPRGRPKKEARLEPDGLGCICSGWLEGPEERGRRRRRSMACFLPYGDVWKAIACSRVASAGSKIPRIARAAKSLVAEVGCSRSHMV